MILKPFPRHLVDEKGCIDDTRLLPHWLPMPPHPSTHQARHLGLPFDSHPVASPGAPSSMYDDGEDRWSPLEVRLPSASAGDAARPILRVFVMSTKRRIHKRAVIRHRVRTRLVAALRTAVFRLEEADVDVVTMLDLRKNVMMLVAQPSVYLRDMDALVQQVGKALRSVGKYSTPSTRPSPRLGHTLSNKFAPPGVTTWGPTRKSS